LVASSGHFENYKSSKNFIKSKFHISTTQH
jgi:hypothetical protein